MKRYFKVISKLIVLIGLLISFTSCTENYSNGDRVGLISKFSKKGLVFNTWEGSMSITQTGMNQSGNDFEFSIDRDNQNDELINKIDSAVQLGYKVKLRYHETYGWNWWKNRGETDYFVTSCEILDKTPVQSTFNGNSSNSATIIHDTIYVVIVGQTRHVTQAEPVKEEPKPSNYQPAFDKDYKFDK
jgi:hypothetical protein